ncbi:MAG TPA: dickkopf-related protein [Polyangiaceae bacterium]
MAIGWSGACSSSDGKPSGVAGADSGSAGEKSSSGAEMSGAAGNAADQDEFGGASSASMGGKAGSASAGGPAATGGSKSGTGGTRSTASIDDVEIPAEFFAGRRAVICKLYRYCCAEQGFDWSGLDSCADDLAGQDSTEAKAKAGTVRVVENKVAACLSGLKALVTSCEASQRKGEYAGVAACDGVLEGAIELGEPCASTSECAQGQVPVHCLAGEGEMGHCRAVPAGALGDTCLGTGDSYFTASANSGAASCAREAGLYCQYSSKKCVEVVKDGKGCSDSQECAVDSYCAGSTCQPFKTTGEACAKNSECASTTCAGGHCVANLLLPQSICEQGFAD